MTIHLPLTLRLRSVAATALLLTGATGAYAADTYDFGSKQLTAPAVTIGNAIYSNVVFGISGVVSGPSGSTPGGSADSYNPANGQIAIPAVSVGGKTYYNVVATVGSLVSIGSVTGADSFNGTDLTVASVQVGSRVYSNVVLAVSIKNVVSLASGVPTAIRDQYDPSTGRLFIPAVQVGSRVYTNVTLTATLGNIVSIGGNPAVPNVVGETQAVATTALTSAGLVVGAVTQNTSATVPAGEVIAESPAAGSFVAPGSAVSITVSTGAVVGGIVASGNPVVNGFGYALDAATGARVAFTTDGTGTYSANLAGYAGPFLFRVLGVTTGGLPVDIHSLAGLGGSAQVNITPLSDAILGNASGVTTAQLEAACTASQGACATLLNGILGTLAARNAALVAAIPATVFTAFGVDAASFNAFTTPFVTNHTGIDGLLDALRVTLPVTRGGSYAISLAGATPIQLATLPTSGSAGTPGGAATSGTAPTATVLAQAVNIVAVQGEIQAFFAKFSALFATGYPTVQQITPLIDPSFLLDGTGASAFISASATGQTLGIGTVLSGGSLAPYTGGAFSGQLPGPSATFDANNCVKTLWVLNNLNAASGFEVIDTLPAGNAPGVCTGGTWTFAGTQRNYGDAFRGRFDRYFSSLGSTSATLVQTFQLGFNASESTGNPGASGTPYAYINVTGPGLATIGNPAAAVGTVQIIAPAVPTPPATLPLQSAINDPYYGGVNGGTSLLSSCTDIVNGSNPNYTSATPCFNANVTGGSDYLVQFFDAAAGFITAQEERINLSLNAVAIPATFYPTITTITPSSSASVPAGTTSTITTTWTSPDAVSNDDQ